VKMALCCLLVLTTGWLNASKRDSQNKSLAKYLARVQVDNRPRPRSPWEAFGWMRDGWLLSAPITRRRSGT